MMKRIYMNTKFNLLAFMLVISGFLSAQVITLGSGTTAHLNTDPGPINEYFRSLHSQTLYTAAELNSAGIAGGSIIKLGFYIVSGVTNPLPNYTIKLKHTTATDVSVYDGTGLTTHFNTASYNPPAGGFDMLTLSTPFIWNGVDNILLDVCFDQVSAYTSTGVVRVYNTTVTNGYIYERDDNSSQCGVTCTQILNTKPQVSLEFIPLTPLDLGVNALLNPVSTKMCYAVDTIVARVKNYGSATADFAVNPTVVTVKTTGPNAGTYTLALNTGTLASNSTQNFTMSTTYNLSAIGTYKLKAYTTVAGDGSPVNDTTNLTVTRSPLFSTSVLPNDSVCLGVPVQLNANYSLINNVGNGTTVNLNTGYPAPYGNFYEGAKHQFLFLASELTASGVVAGNINSISFYATNLNASNALTNYNIAIATTTLTNITAFQTTGFATYYSSASYAPVLGKNTHPFSSPFVWDGVSNIIIETCFNNTPAGYSYNVSVAQSATPFSSTVWHNADATPALCTQTVVSSSMNQRPNIGFEQPAVINYTWSPATELSAVNISNPVANVTGTRTYTITGVTSGCMTYDTVRIFSKPTPTPNLGNDSLFCGLPVVLYANTSANSFLWDSGSTNSNLNVTASGKYWVKATNTNGCTNTDTILVTLGTSPIVALGPDTAFCQGSTINLYASNGLNNSYLWSTGATSTSITVGTAGTYSVIATHTSGCQASDVSNVSSKAKPAVSLTFAGQTVYCVDDNFNRVLTEGTPSGGTYIGASVTSNTFNTTQAGQGSHIILYSYTGSNGCSNVAKDTLTVNACVGVEELTETIALNVYPNPTTGIFTLELNTSADADGIINITSIDGKVVFADKVDGSGLIIKSINISDLANGIYYLKVETRDAMRTYKILKQ